MTESTQPEAFAALSVHWSPTHGLLWWDDGTYVTALTGEIEEVGLALPEDALVVAIPGYQEHRDGPPDFQCPHCLDQFTPADVVDGGVLVVCAMCAKADREAT